MVVSWRVGEGARCAQASPCAQHRKVFTERASSTFDGGREPANARLLAEDPFSVFRGRGLHSDRHSPRDAESPKRTRHAIVSSARDRPTAQNVLHDASGGTKPALHLGGTERTVFVRNIVMLHYATIRASNVLAARQASGFMHATNDRAGTRD